MTTELITTDQFRAVLSAITAIGSFWGVIDAVRLIRLRGADGSDPIVRDKRFGYTIGMFVGAIGYFGILRFNGVL